MPKGVKYGGRAKGSINKKTAARLANAGREIAESTKPGSDVVRATRALSDLTKTAMGFAAYWQTEMIKWQGTESNAGKLVPGDYVDRFMLGINTAIRAASALAPYQDPKLGAIKVTMSPFDVPPEPKVIEGKATSKKIDITDPIELSRIYHSLVRAA